MAEYGFLTIAFDPSFTGESGDSPRYVASPNINTEDFYAAVDFLSVQENVDTDRIGIIGICGWGGMAINAAAQLELSEPGVFIAKNPTVSCISGFPAYFMDRLR